MAHKGKDSPVLYRRDLNLNVSTNNRGFFRRYLVRFPNMGNGSGHVISGQVADCGPDDYASLPTIRWTSVPKITPALSWQCALEVHVSADDYSWDYFFYDVATGLAILQWRPETVFDDRLPRMPFGAPQKLVFEDPAYFPQGVPIEAILIRNKLWRDGSPH